MTYRRISFTLNNYTDEVVEQLLHDPLFSFIIIGKEISDSGTPHLQGYAELIKVCRPGPISKKYSNMHIEMSKGTAAQNIQYCSKDGDYYSNGKPKVEGGEQEKARWASMIKMAEEGKLEELKETDPNAYVRLYKTWHQINQDAMPEPESIDSLDNLWIWGPTGVGKSRGIRKIHPQLYPKARNKWWCGYKNQEVVALEEVNPKDAEWLASFLKVWADHYPFIAEIKGRSKMIRPKKLIVTSNYPMESVFQTEEDLLPLKRRFKQIHMITPNHLEQAIDKPRKQHKIDPTIECNSFNTTTLNNDDDTTDNRYIVPDEEWSDSVDLPIHFT